MALRELVEDISHEVGLYKELKAVPARDQQNVRNDMYVASAALNIIHKKGNPKFEVRMKTRCFGNYQKKLDTATKFIPLWVKVAGSCVGAGHGHDGGLEAHRGYGRREDR